MQGTRISDRLSVVSWANSKAPGSGYSPNLAGSTLVLEQRGECTARQGQVYRSRSASECVSTTQIVIACESRPPPLPKSHPPVRALDLSKPYRALYLTSTPAAVISDLHYWRCAVISHGLCNINGRPAACWIILRWRFPFTRGKITQPDPPVASSRGAFWVVQGTPPCLICLTQGFKPSQISFKRGAPLH